METPWVLAFMQGFPLIYSIRLIMWLTPEMRREDIKPYEFCLFQLTCHSWGTIREALCQLASSVNSSESSSSLCKSTQGYTLMTLLFFVFMHFLLHYLDYYHQSPLGLASYCEMSSISCGGILIRHIVLGPNDRVIA